jgi:hypothetical protein
VLLACDFPKLYIVRCACSLGERIDVIQLAGFDQRKLTPHSFVTLQPNSWCCYCRESTLIERAMVPRTCGHYLAAAFQ